MSSGGDWFVRTDTVENWMTLSAPRTGWEQATVIKAKMRAAFPVGDPQPLWTAAQGAGTAYFWKPFFLDGAPREAAIYFASAGRYELYVNGQLVSADTAGARVPGEIDSVTGLETLLAGGDNVIALSADPGRSGGAVAMSFVALVDTNQHFESTLKLPEAETFERTEEVAPAREAAGTAAESAAVDTAAGRPAAVVDYAKEFRNKGELLRAIADYEAKEKDTASLLRRERLEVQKLHIRRDALDKSIDDVKAEIEELKKALEEMGRTR